jgi:L-serine dehydratase
MAGARSRLDLRCKLAIAMDLSIFDIFRIGIGPSSSHTVGPMKAAREFAVAVREKVANGQIAEIRVELFGSLALTGMGHGTDRAIQLGLIGEKPEEIDCRSIDEEISLIRSTKTLSLLGQNEIPFDASLSIVFRKGEFLPKHPNGMRFIGCCRNGRTIVQEDYYSVGGGSITKEGVNVENADVPRPPTRYSFRNAAELLRIGETEGLAIWQVILENEKVLCDEAEVRTHVDRIWEAMRDCMERGLHTEGVLPGGLNVRRRAAGLARSLERDGSSDQLVTMDWVNAYAMAVNEENAAGGRVVTAPTNGAAGVVPAVAQYYLTFVPGASTAGLFRYLLTAGAIGMLYKRNASISGAEVGCQGEVGAACSMAAGGLVAALGGTNGQVESAAEIGMEHNLGMTCDPIGGLVQIPCIERNAMGAVKAINACRMAMRQTGAHKVSLDQVIETMFRTGIDMQSRYKETSLGGLALNIIEC